MGSRCAVNIMGTSPPRAEGDSVCHVTGWKWTICIHKDCNIPLVNSSWNEAAPYSQVTLSCVINLSYSIGKGESQQGVRCEKVCRGAPLQERRLLKFYPISISALNQKYSGQSSSLIAHSSTFLIFLCFKVFCKDNGQREGENRKDLWKSENSEGLSWKQ